VGLKDEAWRLQPAAYPRHLTLHPRYGDMDVNAHLNNVAIARLFEETRVQMLSALRGRPVGGGDPSSMMIVHVGIDYLLEGGYPDPIDAGLAAGGMTAMAQKCVHACSRACHSQPPLGVHQIRPPSSGLTSAQTVRSPASG
jgi:hypothetical protein